MRSEDELQLALSIHHENLRATLARVAASPFEIVLDLVLRETEVLKRCLAALTPRQTFVVGVHCPLHVLETRERAREDRGEGMARSQFGHPAYSRPYFMRLDTSTCTPQAGATQIRSAIARQRSSDA